jgi:hypothetical protein
MIIVNEGALPRANATILTNIMQAIMAIIKVGAKGIPYFTARKPLIYAPICMVAMEVLFNCPIL